MNSKLRHFLVYMVYEENSNSIAFFAERQTKFRTIIKKDFPEMKIKVITDSPTPEDLEHLTGYKRYITE